MRSLHGKESYQLITRLKWLIHNVVGNKVGTSSVVVKVLERQSAEFDGSANEFLLRSMMSLYSIVNTKNHLPLLQTHWEDSKEAPFD